MTGMHRSGTSLVAMTLNALGLDFGDDDEFYAADEWNQKGYFERRDVVDLNSRLITGFTRTQGVTSSSLGKIRYLTQPSPEVIATRGNALKGEIEHTALEIGDLHVKDPRFVLTVDSWRPHVSQIVVCLRRPDQVAFSLKRRQRVPLGISYGFWNYHARAILAIAHDRMHYVDFDVLAGGAPEAELVGLARFLGIESTSPELVATLRAHFTPTLKHFDPSDAVDLPSPTRDLWEQLSARRTSLANG
ncbi:MAG TPA: hypothetical protein VFU96_01000 [Acidimicrobiia bacterium]|nr:hypothetical protein [Acidimicrobiia bacterium]